MFVDVLPNVLAPVIVYTTLLIPLAIVSEATLSFLGLGVPAPTAVSDGLHHGRQRPRHPGRHPQPGPHVLTVEAAEGHVVRPDRGQPGRHLGQAHAGVGGGESGLGPEVAEVRGRGEKH